MAGKRWRHLSWAAGGGSERPAPSPIYLALVSARWDVLAAAARTMADVLQRPRSRGPLYTTRGKSETEAPLERHLWRLVFVKIAWFLSRMMVWALSNQSKHFTDKDGIGNLRQLERVHDCGVKGSIILEITFY
jgi:hypothetical protein